MNRTRIAVVVGIAILLALVASFGVYRFLSEKSRMAEKARLETVGIAVAVVEIPLGSTINSNQVAISAWPKENYPKDAIADLKSVLGRVARREFLRGEPIVESKLVPTEKGGGGILSLKIPEGMRAFSVKVNEVVGVGGFVVPDSRVDIVVTTALSSKNQQNQFSKIVLEDILVLAAGQSIEVKEEKPVTVNTVTVAVTPEEAEKLALASNDGKIQLVMRSFADSEKVMTSGIDKSRLLASYRNVPATSSKTSSGSRRAARRVAAPPSRKHTVEVFKGTKRSEEHFTE